MTTETPERVLAHYERQKARLSMPLGRRLDAALRQASLLSHLSASTQDPDHIISSETKSKAPPPVEGGLYQEDDIVETFSRRIGLMVAALEREVDAHKYRPLAGVLRDESGEEKDARIIRDFEGVSSEEVSFIDPTLGSPRTVERARTRCGMRPSNGRPRR